MRHLKTIEDEISTWASVSVHPHRFGGREFRFGNAEIGHVHTGGTVDVPFPRSLRDALLAEGLAEEHHWVPNSGWVTFHIRSGGDLRHALSLLRLSCRLSGRVRSRTSHRAGPRELRTAKGAAKGYAADTEKYSGIER